MKPFVAPLIVFFLEVVDPPIGPKMPIYSMGGPSQPNKLVVANEAAYAYAYAYAY